MMSNLFSVFEPSSSLMVPLNWASIFLVFMFIPTLKWASMSRPELATSLIYSGLKSEYKTLLNGKSPFVILVFMAAFIYILINNFMGLFPYVFTASSHLVFTLTLALPLWLGYMAYGFTVNTSHSLAHITPQGTPMVLVPLMILIESVSNLIRPFTLAVRLAANMIAGHLLLTLMSSGATGLTTLAAGSLVVAQTILLLLEVAVSMIQAYVFTTLSVLYVGEIN